MADGPTGQRAVVELVGWRGRRGRFIAASAEARSRSRDALRALGKRAVALAEKESPRGRAREGRDAKRFADSWTFAVTDTATGATGELTNEAPHAAFVIFPTKAHVIRPKRAKLLRWVDAGGEVRFARQVHHPGTKGNDVPARVLAALGTDAERELQRVGRDATRYLEDVFGA